MSKCVICKKNKDDVIGYSTPEYTNSYVDICYHCLDLVKNGDIMYKFIVEALLNKKQIEFNDQQELAKQPKQLRLFNV